MRSFSHQLLEVNLALALSEALGALPSARAPCCIHLIDFGSRGNSRMTRNDAERTVIVKLDGQAYPEQIQLLVPRASELVGLGLHGDRWDVLWVPSLIVVSELMLAHHDAGFPLADRIEFYQQRIRRGGMFTLGVMTLAPARPARDYHFVDGRHRTFALAQVSAADVPVMAPATRLEELRRHFS